eukprot:TRINITY_DN31470_c0_g1_i1.p2 TRINITY_DN31470_c0_g1~~TRINITY_DN31470_c0_g1_i1.p2  ORF type:complete len:468 (+),score=107.83 TRINITY_DN31470_c0_g1_i1:31-1404(+)
MAKDAEEAPATGTQLYSKLSADQQASLQEAILQRLKSIIGGYGELAVLSEYISVMLQSSRPPEQVQSELEAFLQEQSAPFTTWLCENVAKMASELPPAEEGTSSKRRRREKRAEREAADKPVEPDTVEKKKSKREKKNGGVLAAAAAAAPGAPPLRSGSRKRRRRNSADADADAADVADGAEEGIGTSAGSREPADRKAKLTPNVEYLRGAYHAPKAESHSSADGKDTRWSFRADGPASQGAAPPAPLGPPAVAHHYPPPQHYYPPPHHYHYPPPGAVHPAPALNAPPANAVFAAAQTAVATAPAPRPARFIHKKWRVVRPNTVVRASEKLDSAEVQKLQVGEIVEQVAPAFTTENGLIRIQIRHPSSSVFPNPIGWVTQDATAAGGPKFLEPGPEPMQKSTSSSWRPPATAWAAPAWRPRGYAGQWAARPAAAAANGRPSFQNLTWKPPADTASAD